MEIKGLHHITAVSGRIQQNLAFYTRVLGLRLVKKSVNQDDVSAYHLFYADRVGSPGTDMTFFDWPHIDPNQPGTDSIRGTAFRVAGKESLSFWEDRLLEHGAGKIKRAALGEIDLLSFQDPEGQQLYLIDDHGARFEGDLWPRPDIPERHLLRGFYAVILSTPDFNDLQSILTTGLQFSLVEEGKWIDGLTPLQRYQTHQEGGPGSEVWVLEEPGKSLAQLGAGGVHHVAFGVKNQQDQTAWRNHLRKLGIHATRIIDRFWFKSISFRVTRGILIECKHLLRPCVGRLRLAVNGDAVQHRDSPPGKTHDGSSAGGQTKAPANRPARAALDAGARSGRLSLRRGPLRLVPPGRSALRRGHPGR